MINDADEFGPVEPLGECPAPVTTPIHFPDQSPEPSTPDSQIPDSDPDGGAFDLGQPSQEPPEPKPEPKPRHKPQGPEPLGYAPMMGIREATKALRVGFGVITKWIRDGKVPGGKLSKTGNKVPSAWVESILNGRDASPDGVNRAFNIVVQPPMAPVVPPGTPVVVPETKPTSSIGDKPMPAKTPRAELLNRIVDEYGKDANVKVEVHKRGPAGYAFDDELTSIPTRADLQQLYPAGGDFRLRIFKSGKPIDEVSGIVVNAADGTPYNPQTVIGPVPLRSPAGIIRPRGAGPTGPPGPPPPSMADHLMRKAVDKAFDTPDPNAGIGSILSTVMNSSQTQADAINRQLDAERLARREETRRAEDKRNEERKEAEARRKEEKEEYEAEMENLRQEFERKHALEMDKFNAQLEATRVREQEFFARQKELEAERTTTTIKQSQDFFTQLRELDNKREEVLEKARSETMAMQEKIHASQEKAVEETRRSNERIYAMQMEHFKEMKESSNSANPISLLAETIKPIVEKISSKYSPGGMGGMGGLQQPAENSLAGTATGGPGMGMIEMMKGQQFFADEMQEASMKVKLKISPAFTVNKLMGLMQMNPNIGIVLDYIITRDIGEVVRGVNLNQETLNLLTSPEGVIWWNDFKRMLIQTMQLSAQAQVEMMASETPAGGGEAAPADGGASGSVPPQMNQGHV